MITRSSRLICNSTALTGIEGVIKLNSNYYLSKSLEIINSKVAYSLVLEIYICYLYRYNHSPIGRVNERILIGRANSSSN